MGSTDSNCCGSQTTPIPDDEPLHPGKCKRQKRYHQHSIDEWQYYQGQTQPYYSNNDNNNNMHNTGPPSNQTFTYNINITSNVQVQNGLTLNFGPVQQVQQSAAADLNAQSATRHEHAQDDNESCLSELSEAYPCVDLDKLPTLQLNHQSSNLVHRTNANHWTAEDIEELEKEMRRELRRLSVRSVPLL